MSIQIQKDKFEIKVLRLALKMACSVALDYSEGTLKEEMAYFIKRAKAVLKKQSEVSRG